LRRGVSELVATIVIVAIVLAAGAFVFAWTHGLIRFQSTQHEIQVVQAKLSYTTGSGWYITVDVKNVGSVTVSEVKLSCLGSVQIYDGGSWVSEATIGTNLAPGQAKGKSWQIRNVSLGSSYSFRVRVWFSDGAYKEYLITLGAGQG